MKQEFQRPVKMNRCTQLVTQVVLMTVLGFAAATTVTSQDVISFKKLGCFTDKSQGFLVDNLRNVMDSSNITNACISHCEAKGTLFAALTNKSICTCGVMYDNQKKTEDTVCNITCDGGFTCGGPSAATLYQITPKTCSLPNSTGYVMFDQSCYHFVTVRQNWEDSEKKCVSEGGHLASIHNSRENNFVVSLIAATLGVNFWYLYTWVGGISYPNGQGFEWVEGTPVDFDQWRLGNPKFNSVEACLELLPVYPSSSDKGAWRDSLCYWRQNSVCKRSANQSYTVVPSVYKVQSGAATACAPVNADKFLNNSLGSVLASYPLMLNDVTGVTVNGRAFIPATATYTHFNTGVPDNTTNPTFVTDNTWNRKVMKFSGDGQVIENSPGHAEGTVELSVAVWVKCANLGTTPPQEMIIVSKSKDEGTQIVLAWALTIEKGTQYCLLVGTLKYCTVTGTVKEGVAQHVTAIYFGTRIEIFVNGEVISVSASGDGQATVVPESNYPLVIGGAYRKLTTTGIPATNFKGELQDVRVYGKALNSVDADYMYCCTGRETTDMIYLYEGTDAQLEFGGRELKNDQRVGLSVAPCVGAPIDFTKQSPTFMKSHDTANTAVTLPGTQIRKPSFFNRSNTGFTYNLCIATPLKPKQYQFSTGVKVMVTLVTSVEQNSMFAVVPVEGTTIDKSIRIGGTGLEDGQVIAVSQTDDCLVTVGDATMTGTNTNKENATVQLKFEALTAVYYLCWKGDSASPGKPTGLAIHFIGKNFVSRKVAVNDGTMKITVSDVKNGVPIRNGSFFVPCRSLESLGTNVFYEVAMGDYIDYLIPMVGATGCDVLSGETVYLAGISRYVNKYYYSPISPLSSDFERAGLPISSSYDSIGGSAGLQLKERDSLNVWGTAYYWGYSGGCCKLRSTQSHTWNLPYTITAYNFDANQTYFQVLEAPATVFVNEQFNVSVQEGDIYGKTDGKTCTLKMQVDDETPVVFTGNPCLATFTYTVTSTTATIKLYVGDTLKRQLSVSTIGVPTGFQTLSVDKKVKKALGWNLDKDKGKFPSFVALNYDRWFLMNYRFFSVSDREMKPFTGMKDEIRVPKYWWEVLRNDPGSWLATETDSEGRFGSGVTNASTVQYFAFVLYIIERQNVKFEFKCVDECDAYMGGSSLSSNNVYDVDEGYHQVIIKTFTTKTNGLKSGFTFELSEGYGIAVGLEMPPISAPGNDDDVLAPGEFVTEFLTVKKPFEGSFETDYLSENNSDATVKPVQSDPLFIRVADSGGNFSVRRNGAAGKRIVNYFSAGLLASNDGRITIGLPVVGGMTIIWLDGNVVYSSRGTIEGGDEFGFKVTEGWHQLLIKVYVAEGADDWMFKMKALESENTVVFITLQMPSKLPEDASNIFKKQINKMISPGEYIHYNYWSSTFVNHISFNFNNTADRAFSDPTFSLIDVTKKQSSGSIDEINGKNLTWKVVDASDDSGVFRIDSGSGAANRYYAFALYFTKSVAQLNLSVMHYSGMGMWMDGKQVLAKKDESASDIVTINNVKKGWRQFHLRLQTPKDMDLVLLGKDDKPQHMCAKNGFNLCAQETDICLDGVPKLGYPLPMSQPAYAAVSISFVGLSGKDLCKTVSSPNASIPIYAACCGTSNTTTQMSVRVIGYTGDALIGWATSIPPPPLKKPTFISQEEDGYTLVTINGMNGTEKIYFEINGGVYQEYTKPINVTTATHIRAFLKYKGMTSPYNEIIISDLYRYKISRSECPAYVPCAVKLSDDIHQVTSSYVVLVDSSLPGTLIKVLNSSTYAQGGGVGFTKLLRVFKSGIFMTPDIGNGRIRFDSRSKTMRMIAFPPGAEHADEPGILVDGSILVSLLNVAPAKEDAKSVKKLNAAPLEVSGGIVAGDFVSFPQLQSNTSHCDEDACFRSMETGKTRHIIGPKGETVPVDLLSFDGDELKCICVAAVGGSDIASDNVLTKHYHPIAIPISIKVVPAEADNTKQELLSFSPSVVSKGDTMHISGYFVDSATVTFRCALDIVKKCSSTVPTFTRTKTASTPESGNVTVKKYKLQNWDGIVGTPGGKSPFGVWRVVVISDGRILKVQGTSLPSVAYLPPPPNVVFMGGLCANMSVNCINGSVIDFIGSGFNSEDLKHNEVILMDGVGRSKTVSCIPYKVTETVLSCLLMIKSVERPKQLMILHVNVATLVTASDDVYGMSLPKSVYETGNSLILNGGERSGWTGRLAPNSGRGSVTPTLKPDKKPDVNGGGSVTLTPTPDRKPDVNGGDDKGTTASNHRAAPNDNGGGGKGKTAGIVVGVLFAIVFVVVLVGGIFVYKNRFKKNKGMGDIQDPFSNSFLQDSVLLTEFNQESSPVLHPKDDDLDSGVLPELSPRSDGWSPRLPLRDVDL